jgi:hypothetical protein
MSRATRGFPKAFRKTVFAAAAVWACAAGARAAVEDPALDKLLLRAAEYCRRIEASVLDFICREEVKETIHPIPAPSLSSSGEITGFRLSNRMPVWLRDKKTYVYDYQCTRSGGRLRETRVLLEDNGRQTHEPAAPLKTTGVAYHNALLNPVNLFAARNQGAYIFRVTGRDRIDGQPVVIIAAEPRPGVRDALCLGGKAWLAEPSGDILKIEWTQEPAADTAVFKQREGFMNGKLRLRMRTEFLAEKNGLRFPSRLRIEEAYIRPKGNAQVRSETDVAYKDFKFFTVAYDVR